MKKVLIIAYHFPPDAAIGAVRPAELAKNLPDSGWEPVVLSINPRYYEGLDPSRYRNLPGKVVRTRKIGSLNDLYLLLKRFIRRENTEPAGGKEWFPAGPKTSAREEIKGTILRYYNSVLIYLPDKEIGWFHFAVAAGLRLIRKEKIDAILTTSPPHSVQLIGLALKLLAGKPWIADFRDPWEIDLKPRRSRSLLSDRIEREMEKRVVNRADRVVSVTDPMTRRLANLYPNHREKFVTLPNGFDSKDLAKYLRHQKYPIFTITYVGSLYFGRNPLIVLTALSELVRDRLLSADEIRVRLVGDCRVSDGRSVEQMVRELGLGGLVTFVDRVPHEEALGEIARSHLLLLMAPSQPLQIPAKVFEYIGLRAAILCLCEEGATRELLDRYPLSTTVEPGDLTGMKEAILRRLRDRSSDREGELRRFSFETYERRSQASRMASLLDEMT